MYPARLDTPPPASRFRRPWSPHPFDPNPLQSSYDVRNTGQQLEMPLPAPREPSEVSVEALDLADYARTLARGDARVRTREALVFQPYDSYPPSPRLDRPLFQRDSYVPPPHPVPVLSPSSSRSHSHSNSGASPPSRGRSPRRPFSLPPPSHHPSTQSHPSYSSAARTYETDDPLLTPPAGPDDEIDIAHFPRFARHWYNDPKSTANDQVRLDAELFDPANVKYDPNLFSSMPRVYSPPYLGSQAAHSFRDVAAVPWGSPAPDGLPVDPQVREERLRMLEREFGGPGVGKSKAEEENIVGSVDSKGRLISEGPKKRAAARWIECLLSLLAAGSSLYAALFVKNKTSPPPAGKAPAYVLYVFSVISFLLSTYMFLIYPACCAQRKRKTVEAPYTQGPGGMMVLPVGGTPTGSKKPKGKKGKGEGGDGVQVNLIVNPDMFRGNRDEEEDDDEDELSETGSTLPGSYTSSGRRRRRRGHRGRRRSVFAGLALEAQWKQARKTLKWGTFVDVLLFFLWGAVFVYVLIGKRCPAGAFNGWCDGYNLATAAACLLCLAFGLSIFFDVKDLHSSNVSPRTRTS